MKALVFLFLFFYVTSIFGAVKLNFKEAINQALENSETLQTAKSKYRASNIGAAMSHYRFLPNLKVTATQSQEGNNPNSFDTKSNGYSVSSDLNLFRFGADYYFSKSSNLQEESAKAQIIQTELDEEKKVVTLILDVIKTQKNWNILKKFNDGKKRNYEIAEKRFKSGILSRQELDKVLIDIRLSEAYESDAQQETSDASNKLAIYLGEHVVESDWPWQDKIKQSEVLTLIKKERDYESHPTWVIAKKQAEAAEALYSQKKAEIYPSLDLSLSYTHRNINEIQIKDWYGGLTLTIPLFNRMQDYGASKLAFETKLQNDLHLQRTTKDIILQNKITGTHLKTSLESAIIRDKTLGISHKLFEDGFKRFKIGRSSVNDLLADQQLIYQAEQLAIQGWYAAHLAILNACHARGQRTQDCLD